MLDRIRINRIRLEFKVSAAQKTAQEIQVLIESDWNLKHSEQYTSPARGFVLIESDWNLKPTETPYLSGSLAVLIESDWNLKKNVKNFVRMLFWY